MATLTERDIYFGLMKADLIFHKFAQEEINKREFPEFAQKPVSQDTLDKIKTKLKEVVSILTNENNPGETIEWMMEEGKKQ